MLQVSHIVNSVFNSRTYILSCDGRPEYWLVDCGDVEPLRERLAAMSGGADFSVRGVLLTHAHFDHIYGLPRLRERFPRMGIYTNEWGRKALGDDRLNMSRYHETPIRLEADGIVACGEGATVGLFEGVTASVYETPGHNPSCLAFGVENFLFTGDAYIPGVAVVTTLPGGDKALARASLARLQSLAEGKILCPGHD